MAGTPLAWEVGQPVVAVEEFLFGTGFDNRCTLPSTSCDPQGMVEVSHGPILAVHIILHVGRQGLNVPHQH